MELIEEIGSIAILIVGVILVASVLIGAVVEALKLLLQSAQSVSVTIFRWLILPLALAFVAVLLGAFSVLAAVVGAFPSYGTALLRTLGRAAALPLPRDTIRVIHAEADRAYWEQQGIPFYPRPSHYQRPIKEVGIPGWQILACLGLLAVFPMKVGIDRLIREPAAGVDQHLETMDEVEQDARNQPQTSTSVRAGLDMGNEARADVVGAVPAVAEGNHSVRGRLEQAEEVHAQMRVGLDMGDEARAKVVEAVPAAARGNRSVQGRLEQAEDVHTQPPSGIVDLPVPALTNVPEQRDSGHPVLQPRTVRASSELRSRYNRFSPRMAFDNNVDTAWGEGVSGSGAGEWIEASFDDRYEISRLEIATGYDAVSDEHGDLFHLNAHVRRLRVEADGQLLVRREVGESERRVVLTDLGEARTIRLVAEQVWAGRRWDDLHISDVVMWGSPLGSETDNDEGEGQVETARHDQRDARPTRQADCELSVRASSELRSRSNQFAPRMAFDGDPDTAWGEGVSGHGAGEWIEANFDDPCEISRLEIATGYDAVSNQHGDLFHLNAHVRRLRVEVDGRVVRRIDILESQRQIVLTDLGIGRSVRLVAEQVWPGTRWDDLHISEVSIATRPR